MGGQNKMTMVASLTGSEWGQMTGCCESGNKTVVVYGCETWSLTWMEESRLRVFENRVLRRIFGPKRDEVIGE
jgi:hypothetical protein